jgi:hypothetical protein
MDLHFDVQLYHFPNVLCEKLTGFTSNISIILLVDKEETFLYDVIPPTVSV